MANTMKTLLKISALVVLVALVVKGEDDDHGVNTVNLNIDSFDEALEKNRNFVMFYAPWCGHCKNLSPTWDQLAKFYNSMEDGPVTIAKVDCTVEDKLCAEQEIVGFPTLKLFERGGDPQKRYTGKRDLDSLKAFVQENTLGKELPIDDDSKPPVPDPKSSLIILDNENFEKTVANGLFFIKFYAPWCGHCKKLAPVWDDLADSFSETNDVAIAKIDCTVSQTVCTTYGIRGYPTLLWFKDGVKVDQYQGSRSHEDLKAYVSKMMASGDEELEKEEPKKTEAKVEFKFARGTVADLNADNFKSFISDKLVFVKFFAPWCGHCKRLAPTWDELAKSMVSEDVVIAKVDCTQHKSICEENQVRGYPTLKIFLNGELKQDYKGSRSLEDLHGFVKNFLGHDEL